MKRHSIVLATGLSLACSAHAVLDDAAAAALMNKNGCDACHELARKVVGPAFRDVVLRYVFFHSLALAGLMGLLVMAQAYVPPFTLLVVGR